MWNDGTEAVFGGDPVEVTYGQKYQLPLTDPERLDGERSLKFLGWYTGNTAGTKITANTKVSSANLSDTDPSVSTDLYAHWINGWLIHFDVNGGQALAPAVASQVVQQGKKLSTLGALPKPTKDYAVFSAWYLGAPGPDGVPGGAKVTSSTKPAPVSGAYEVTYYAKWDDAYRLTWDPNGGTIKTKAGDILEDGKLVKNIKVGKAVGTLPPLTRTGYTFKGWYPSAAIPAPGENPDGKTKVKTTDTPIKKAAYTAGTKDVTYYAKWTAKTSTVTLNANGGKGAPAKITVTYDIGTKGTPIGSITPTRTGAHTFDGWYTKKTGGVPVTEAYLKTLTKSITIYAHWV
jgi:uncharacterized repeat protein (TIGR02543 family)